MMMYKSQVTKSEFTDVPRKNPIPYWYVKTTFTKTQSLQFQTNRHSPLLPVDSLHPPGLEKPRLNV